MINNDEKIIQDIFKDNKWNLSKEELDKYEKVMRDIFIEGKSPNQALGFDKEMMEQIYAYALNFYRLGLYDKACDIFRFVVLLDSTNPKYAQALGATFHRLKNYPMALECYYGWSQLDTTTPLPFFYMSDCFEQLNLLGDQKYIIEQAIQRCANQEEYALLKGKLELQLEGLKLKINELMQQQTEVKEAPMAPVKKGTSQ